MLHADLMYRAQSTQFAVPFKVASRVQRVRSLRTNSSNPGALINFNFSDFLVIISVFTD